MAAELGEEARPRVAGDPRTPFGKVPGDLVVPSSHDGLAFIGHGTTLASPDARIVPMGRRSDRGELWLAAQIGLYQLCLAAGRTGPRWPRRGRAIRAGAAAASGATGTTLIVGGLVNLGRSLSPYPRPPQSAELQQHGLYAQARHPVYGGVLLLALSWTLATRPRALVPFAALVGFLAAKSAREERWLEERFSEYAPYRRRVPHRFIPYLW